MRQAALATLVLLSLSGVAQAAEIKHVGDPKALIASASVVPAGSTTIYVSGITPSATNADAPKGTPPVYGDTNAQTMNILSKIAGILKDEDMSMGDVVMMRVYLAADPAKGGKMDFAGMNDAFKTFFGTADQPIKPARVTFQVAQLVNPAFLVEIEAQAAKAPATKPPAKKTKK
jgi:enamine deaminase RidA (YjgF/YER057c/UK114 family)